MKYYRIYFDKIDIVDVEKETDRCIYINGRRILKGGWQGDVFKTFDDAKSELIRRKKSNLEIEIRRHEMAVENRKEEIVKAEHIIQPT